MSGENAFKRILIDNTWQENLNIWRFHHQLVEITQFTNPQLIKSFGYSLDKALDGRFIIITPTEIFGHLLVTVNYQNQNPKLIFESKKIERKYIELEAFHGFTEQDKNTVENLVVTIRMKFQLKQKELSTRNLSTPQPDRAMRLILLRIETMEIVVTSTIHLATNFRAYYENLKRDISKIEEALDQIK